MNTLSIRKPLRSVPGQLILKCVLQLVSIITMCIAWVSMTAGVFGQNLYFNVATTPLVRTYCSVQLASFHTLDHYMDWEGKQS